MAPSSQAEGAWRASKMEGMTLLDASEASRTLAPSRRFPPLTAMAPVPPSLGERTTSQPPMRDMTGSLEPAFSLDRLPAHLLIHHKLGFHRSMGAPVSLSCTPNVLFSGKTIQKLCLSSGSTEATMKSVSSDDNMCNECEYLSDAPTAEILVNDRAESTQSNEKCMQGGSSSNSLQDLAQRKCSPDGRMTEAKDANVMRRYGDADDTQGRPVYFFADDSLQLLATPNESVPAPRHSWNEATDCDELCDDVQEAMMQKCRQFEMERWLAERSLIVEKKERSKLQRENEALKSEVHDLRFRISEAATVLKKVLTLSYFRQLESCKTELQSKDREIEKLKKELEGQQKMNGQLKDALSGYLINF
eukprot:753299-Hanusia_phi.AAC.4